MRSLRIIGMTALLAALAAGAAFAAEERAAPSGPASAKEQRMAERHKRMEERHKGMEERHKRMQERHAGKHAERERPQPQGEEHKH